MNVNSSPLERIRTVNRFLQLALEQVADGVLILEEEPLTAPGPAVVYSNAATQKLFGRSPQSLRGQPCGQLVPGDHWPDLVDALMRAADSGSASFVAGIAPDRNLQWSLTATRDEEGRLMNFIVTIREEKVPPQASRTHETSSPEPAAAESPDDPPAPGPDPESWQRDLLDTIRETARFVAHEFNNSLTAILLPVEMAIREVAVGGDLHSQLEVALESARRAAELARDFLDCFRPRPPVREFVQPAELLRRALRLAACGPAIDARLELSPDLPVVCVDQVQLERVIFNLVRNATQAMPNGGPVRLSACPATLREKQVGALPAGHYLEIRVRDWGPGIDPQHLKHLFHSRFTTKPDGNGCGLAICDRIIRDHKGEIQVRSRVNVGTEFIIYLPAESPPQGQPVPAATGAPSSIVQEAPEASAPPYNRKVESRPHRAPAPGNGTTGRPTLLVVDDEEAVRRAVARIADRLGFETTPVAGSEEALQHYRDRLRAGRPFHSVLLDIHLRSGLTGIELLDAIRRMDPDAFVVATSGQHASGDVDRYLNLGFAAFLPKPYTIEEFDRIMRPAIES